MTLAVRAVGFGGSSTLSFRKGDIENIKFVIALLAFRPSRPPLLAARTAGFFGARECGAALA